MCGINGIISKSKFAKIEDNLVLMNNEIIHRGPDDDGLFIDYCEDYFIGIAMRRLSIIDLSNGKQPFFSSDLNITIVFNGEIYNYNELKEKYLKDYFFKSNSDTEVILALYEKFGTSSFALLDGMFAFCIYDKKIKKAFIARDFFGEKPLYYSNFEKIFYFGSELKSLLKIRDNKPSISKIGLNLFFQLTYTPAPFTIYEGILKLEANKYIEYDLLNFDFIIKSIERPISSKYSHINKKTSIVLTHDLVFESVKSRSNSDVPLGTFLSGGVDSSIISLCHSMQSSQKIDTFSLGFEKKSFDETYKSKQVAKIINSNHHEYILKQNDLLNNINNIILNFDEPFADSSSLPTYVIAEYTKKYVKVALTGDGGDELFGGYNKYYIGKINSFYTKYVSENFHKNILKLSNLTLDSKDDDRGIKFKFNKLMNSISYDNSYFYNIISLAFKDDSRNNILLPQYYEDNVLSFYKLQLGNTFNRIKDFRNIDKVISLEGDLLVKIDRTSMLTSLECRSPFLNQKIWEFTSSIPDSLLINNWNKKYILKEAFKKYFPTNFLNQSKKGFGIPIGDWLRTILKDELLFYTEKKFIKEQNIFNFEEINKLIKTHIEGKTDNTFKVYTFYCFQKWYFNNIF